MRAKRLFAIMLVLSCSACCMASLTAVRYLGNQLHHAVYSIDETTGTGNGLAYVNTFYNFNCMASDNKGNIYSIGTGPGPDFDVHIVLINPKSGQVTPGARIDFNGLDASEKINALAWSSEYGLIGTDANDKLIQIDIADGHGTLIGRVGTIGFPIGIRALAFSPGGKLYGWGIERYGLIEIDPETGEFTDVNPQAGPDSGIQALEFSPDGGTLYGARDFLYTIDTSTGLAAITGTGQGFTDIRGIAFEVNTSLGPKIAYPNGDEMLAANSTVDIKVNLNGINEMMSLELSLDDGDTWSEIAQIQNQSIFSWTAEGISSSCLLKISQVSNPEISDLSNDTFTIFECVDEMPADINHDCQVNLEDLSSMAEAWMSKSPVKINKVTLDTDPGWTIDGLWQFGSPLGMGGDKYGNPDPDSGYTGPNVYGINLDGNYDMDMSGPHYLASGPFNCEDVKNLSVVFARWLNTDSPEYVKATVDFSTDKTNWINIWTNSGAIEDDQWQIVEYPLGDEADNADEVYIRWGHTVIHDRAHLYSGWNIDDVELTGEK